MQTIFKKRRVMSIVGTRPELIKMCRVIALLDRQTDHILVHTGQNYDYGLNKVFFEDLELREPDYYLGAAGETAMKTVADVLIKTEALLLETRPEALLVYGDTNSGLAVIAAKRQKVPVFHMEAGNRCFDDRVPEEINRRIVDHISDINLPYSDIAREYLLREGIRSDRIIKTGSPMREVLDYYGPKIIKSKALDNLSLKAQKYFLVSLHREENVDSPINLSRFMELLNQLASIYGLPIVVSTHPRTKDRMQKLDIKVDPLVQFLKPFSFFDYIKLQLEAKCVLSDSGSITEESSILNFPALNLRETQERPEGFEEGSVILTGLNINSVLQGIEILSTQVRGENRILEMVKDYCPRNVSDKVLRILQSFTDVINRTTWGKVN
jgi:UDP-N-acetylglucosamine 2-epimerase (non-hydrolysing)